MGKKKIQRFAEIKTYRHVIEVEALNVLNKDYELKGKWQENFFGNSGDIVLEIGCGKGEYTLGQARMFPEKNFIGIDRKGARIWRGARTIHEEEIKNAAFLRTNVGLITSYFAPNEVAEIWITFPDPQPKKAVRRLTAPRFLQRYAQFLKFDGTINLKTDSLELHEFTKELVKINNLEILECTDNLYANENISPVLNIKTTYENMFLKEGKPITYLKFRLNGTKDYKAPESKY